MVLTEASPNLQTRLSASTSVKSSAPDGAPKKNNAKAADRAVKSMLRTTTELGDSAQFSTRPPRVPRSGSRIQSTRPRSGSFDSSFASALHHRRSPPRPHAARRRYAPRPTPSLPGISSQGTIRSNLTGYHPNPRSRRRGGRRYDPRGLEDLTSPTSGMHGLYSHRSLVTLRSRRDFPRLHSSSPFPYHPHSGTVDIRSGSPALSDAHSSFQLYRSRFCRHGSFATAASSPVSLYPTHQAPLGYRPDLNGSFASLTRLPSPAVPPISYTPSGQRIPSRSSTPHSMSMLDPRFRSSVGTHSTPGLPKSPTGSSTPYYYDYTESFVEEGCFSPDPAESMAPLPMNMNQTIMEDGPPPVFRHAQTPFGTRPGSKFQPSELPTQHNCRPSELSKGQVELPKRHSSLAAPSRLHGEGDKSQNETRSLIQDVKTPDPKPRRASVASRRTCTSTHSGPFFPNLERISPRDLRSLAAKVHSPGVRDTYRTLGVVEAIADGCSPQIVANPHGLDAFRRDPASWQLPVLSFRPMSFDRDSSLSLARPKTSSDAQPRGCPEILSPTPARPMSSQSRKRFSKILDLDEAGFLHTSNSLPSRSSYRSASPGSKTLAEIAEFADLANQGSSDDQLVDIVGTYADRGSSQNTYREKSTIDSLLDKHIECLGLKPEVESDNLADSTSFQEQCATLSSESTVKPVAMEGKKSDRCRPSTARSWKPFHAIHGGRHSLLPRRLFSSVDETRTGLVKSPAVSCVSDLVKDCAIGSRPSLGWQTLASTSQLSSMLSTKRSLLSGELADISSDDGQWSSNLTGGLSGDGVSGSQSSPMRGLVPLTNSSGRDNRQTLRDLARQASERRKMKIRVKIKRTSQSDRQSWSNVSTTSPVSAATLTSEPEYATSGPNGTIITSAGHLPELSGECVPRPALQSTAIRLQEKSVVSPPRIPNRWSSILAFAHEPVKRSLEMTRRVSVKTVRSNRSNTNIVDPINSTRLSSQLPRSESHVRLAPCDFGNLGNADLTLNLPGAHPPSTIRPTLRETQSFFSDDSSAQKPYQASFRKRFNLHSLRSTMGPATRGVNVATQTPNDTAGNKIHHSCQILGGMSSEHQLAYEETAAMSDFAYRRRKVVEKLKEWWKRQCLQRKFTVMKMKGGKPVPGVLTV